MLPKSERFTKEDFKAIRQKVFFRGDIFDVAEVTIPSKKFACVISKKTIKLAVDRNKIKRRIFNAIKKNKQALLIKQKKSIIFYPKRNIILTPYPQIEEEIKKVFDKLK